MGAVPVIVKWITIGIFVLIAGCTGKQDFPLLKESINEYVTAELHSRADSLLHYIVTQSPPPESVYTYLKNGIQYDGADSGHYDSKLINNDGKARSFGYHLPGSYDPTQKYPLIMWLHGGVNGSNPEKGKTAYRGIMNDSIQAQYIVASVTGEQGATWFHPVGIRNILQGIKYLKRRYSIDENRVFLAGVSDGGSGCYFMGNLNPTPFAGFIVWSGFIGVLNSARLPFHLNNIKSRPWYVVHTGKDHLYPANQVQPYIQYLRTNQVSLKGNVYHNLGHDMGPYAPVERPLVFKWMSTIQRADADTIDWSCELVELGKMDWIEVTKTEDIGLNFKFPIKDQEQTKLFMHNANSSRVLAIRKGNEIRLFVKYISTLNILINPRYFNVAEKITVYINGLVVHNKKVKPDVKVMLEDFRKNVDRTRVSWNILEFDLQESKKIMSELME